MTLQMITETTTVARATAVNNVLSLDVLPIQVTHDRDLVLSVGSSRRSTNWQKKTLSVAALYGRLSRVTYTQETLSEYRAMTRDQQGDAKDVGGFVGGQLTGNRRLATAVEVLNCAMLDADQATEDFLLLMDLQGFSWFAYTTHSHDPENGKFKWRVVIPYSRSVTPDEHSAIARRLGEWVGMEFLDQTTFEPHRLFYWPSAPADGIFEWQHADLPLLDVDAVLRTYGDYRNVAEWPVSMRLEAGIKQDRGRAGDPSSKPGLVGAFCRIWSVPEALERWLPGVYAEAGGDRYTYVQGTSVGGAVVYDDGQFLYSHHGTDPAAMKLLNAWDLVRLHLYGHLDKEVLEETPINRIPSHLAMVALVQDDPDIKRQVVEERLGAARGEFSQAEPVKSTWPSNRAAIESALSVLNPGMGYESWLKVGRALYQGAEGAEDAKDLWGTWSVGGGSNYTPEDCSDEWRSFSHQGVNGTNLMSLFNLAHENGWSGWKEPSRLEKLLEAAKGLTKTSTDQEIKAVLKGVSRVSGLDKTRVYNTIKANTGFSLADLREAEAESRSRGEEVDQLTLAKAIRHAVGAENIIGQESGVWIYREELGIWRALSPREERQLVQTHLELAKQQEQIEAVSKGLVDGVTDVFKSEVHREDHEWEQGCDEAVSTPGGVMTLVKGGWERKLHRREDYRTVQIPVDWDPEATAPRFTKFLEEIFAPDGETESREKATALLEMMGYSLMAHARHEKFIILVGEGSNGKSVLLAVLEKLLGKHNVAGVQPSQFDHPFQRAHLHLKLANIVTEVRQGEVIADAELKGITSGETSTVERKFQHPFNLKPYSTCWFGTNHLPHTRDFSDALFRRALVVRFNRKFDEQDPENLTDPHLKEELFQELPGILRMCLNAYAEALNRKKFTEPQSCKEAKQAWRLEADQAAQFIEDACLKEGKTGSTELFQAYLTWANEQGIRQRLSQKTFSERLMRLGYIKDKTNRCMVFCGLSLANTKMVPAWERAFS